MRKYLVVVATIAVAGCQAINTAMEYNPTVHRVQTEDDTYRVFEHPKGDRIMTTPSLTRTAAAGAVQGASLQLLKTVPEQQKHEVAARKYLDSTGRSQCRIVGGRLIAEPQYEFFFQC